MRRKKLKIAAGKRGDQAAGQDRRDSGHRHRQEQVVLQLSDQTIVSGVLGIAVEETMKLWRNLEGTHGEPQRNQQSGHDKMATGALML